MNWLEKISEFVSPYFPEGVDVPSYLIAAAVLCLGIFIVGILARLIFGKKSVLNQSVSALIGILFIYAVTIVVYSYGVQLDFLVSPLPFIALIESELHIFPILTSHYSEICGHLLNMVILAFLVNLVNIWLPTGKKVFGWFLFRCLSVVIAMALFTLVSNLLNAWLPDELLKWAPVILLGILVCSLLLGALKLVVGAVLTTINPLLAVLYTFFFASLLGKQVSKALLTTVLASILVITLNYFGITAVSVGTTALVAYIPFIIILLILWYVIGHLFTKHKKGEK